MESGQKQFPKDNLVAVIVEYEYKSTDMPLTEMFVDLLKKLTEQYSDFRIFMCNEVVDFVYDSKMGNYFPKDISSEIESLLLPLSPNLTKYDDGIYAFAVLHGANDTGIVLRLVDSQKIQLIYGKTNTTEHFDLIKKAVEYKLSQRDNTGL